MKLRLCVCGGRDYDNRDLVYQTLDKLLKNVPPWKELILVHGDARGADSLAASWAKDRGISDEPHPADWNKHSKGAGPIRNREMLKAGIDFLVAFPGGNGTADMINICQNAGVRVMRVKDSAYSK